MNLSPNFTLEELLRSGKASEANFLEQYRPPEDVILNLRLLCGNILQPLRDLIGVPIKISSGYRCYRVNKAIGGAADSQHLLGQAADIKATGGMTNAELFRVIQEAKLPYDQIIWEYGNREEPAWVHVSYSNRHRQQVLTIT